MPYYKFKDNDIFINTIEMNPQCDFWIYGSKAYYNNADQSIGNSNTPSGDTNLYELNVNRTSDLIYPFLPKGSSLEAFKGVNTATFNALDMGSLMTGSYPLTASITTQVFDTSATRTQINALRNTLDYYKNISRHYAYSSSLGNKSTQRLTMLDIPSIFYGSSLNKGSIELSFYVEGSLLAKLTDKNKNGELIQSSGSIAANDGKVAGVVLYNEGIIVLTGSWDLSTGHTEKYISDGGSAIRPRWNAYARKTDQTNKSSYQIKTEGVSHTNVITMMAHANAGDLNYSQNPTFAEFKGNEYVSNFSTSSFVFQETPKNLVNTVSSSFAEHQEKFQKQMQEYNDASLAFSLGKGPDPATDSRFDEYRKKSQARSDQAAGKSQNFNEQALISSTGGRDTFAAESTGVINNMKLNDLTKDILNNTGGTDMSTSNVADGSQNIGNTGASSTTGGARYNLNTPFDFDSDAFSFIDDLGDNSEEQLKKVNATADAAIDQGFKDAVEKTTAESMGAAKAGEKNRFSKTRGGLFGNYGKEVTINKIVNPETGKVSREKFVDGKYVSSTAERKNFRKQKKEGRQKARQQKISNIKDKVTGVFEKSKENRTKRQKARSNRRNNKFTGGLF